MRGKCKAVIKKLHAFNKKLYFFRNMLLKTGKMPYLCKNYCFVKTLQEIIEISEISIVANLILETCFI